MTLMGVLPAYGIQLSDSNNLKRAAVIGPPTGLTVLTLMSPCVVALQQANVGFPFGLNEKPPPAASIP